MKGAEILIESFRKEKVDVVFGYPGGSVLDIFDIIYKSGLRFILTRHEQGAAHAADGYARATGKTGVCIATSGPGATNLVTGIATAYMDSVPMVAITGQVPTRMIGNDAFQEADITGITRPITKHNYLVKDIDELPRILKEAFYIANTGRPGPVLVDIPKDIQNASTDNKYPDSVEMRGYKPNYEGHIQQIKKAAEMIMAAQRPVIYAGGGVIISNGSEELTKLAGKAGIPVTTTLLGLGSFPSTDDLSLGMLGMHGTKYANLAVQDTDLLIAVGARFDDRVTGKVSEFAPHAKVIHIDIDPTSIRKNVNVDIPVVGDVKKVLAELIKNIKKCDTQPWLKKIAGWKKEYPLSYGKGGLKPQFVIEKIYELTRGDAIITTEVGQNQMWAAQFYKYTRPRTFLSSGGLGTMGYGLPAAMGAQAGCPGKLVFDIAGDGSIQMNIQELTTCVLNKLPVKIIILNNGCLGMVRQWQELFYGGRYSSTILNSKGPDGEKGITFCEENKCHPYLPDFIKLAGAFGAEGVRISKDSEVIPALKKAIESDKTYIIECIVDPEENVFPMVPAGASLNEMIESMA
ncbi:biosynthetic-type acetolactate synthase large subunit [bacterium]|jgi:acetolactate synthase-1/2/3 large subunit|nr:biosynthetic-type acetolactate synthase large subunit [bacterium]